jgi:hypothetical protein
MPCLRLGETSVFDGCTGERVKSAPVEILARGE